MKNIAESQVESAEAAARPENLPLFALFGANIISYVGDIMMLIAIPWFVLQTTGSVTKTGLTAFFSTLPIVLAAFFGGGLVDRLGYKRTSVVSDLTSGVSVALIPLLYATVGLAFWQLLVLVFFAGLLQTPGMTARSSILPDLVARTKMPLERANSISDGIRRVAGFIGAPLAGVLIALTGTNSLLWLNAGSFILSAMLVALFVTKTPATAKNEGVRQYLADLREGLRFIRRTPVILAITITVMITNLLDAAHGSVIYPDYVLHFFNSAVILGILIASFGGAAFAGAIIFGVIGHRLPRRLTLCVCFTLLSLRFWVMALVPPLFVLIGISMLSGLMAGPINPIMSTIDQEQVPQEMRARVFGMVGAGSYLGIPLGAIVGSFLVQWTGLQLTLLIVGACYLVTTASLFVNPGLGKMERPV